MNTKPFNLAQAKCGAPFRTLADEPVEILKWDMKYGDCPLLGIVGDEQVGARWTVDGKPNGASPSNYKLVMTPLGYIDGKPVFVDDEIELKCFAPPNEWKRVKAEPGWANTWNDNGEYARWPVTSCAAHDMAIAKAVRDYLMRLIASYSYGAHDYCLGKVDLAAIIAKVKP